MKKTNPKVTIDDLAGMVQNGFSELKGEMNEKFALVDKRFDEIDTRLDRIENIVIARHDREIEQLRERVLILEHK
jgi:glutamyl-tRNA reductase